MAHGYVMVPFGLSQQKGFSDPHPFEPAQTWVMELSCAESAACAAHPGVPYAPAWSALLCVLLQVGAPQCELVRLGELEPCQAPCSRPVS